MLSDIMSIGEPLAGIRMHSTDEGPMDVGTVSNEVDKRVPRVESIRDII